jgi:arylsulfatase
MVAACLVPLLASQQCHGAPPNVVIVLADDMGFSDLGCYGGEIRTPNLDALAANGLRFTQFYNTARCCPTRAALLTGLYSHQAGMGHMTEDKGGDGYRGDLNTHCVTIAEALKPAGYRAYAVGKWHVTKHTGPNGPKDNWPLQRGFDRYYGTLNGAGNYFGPDTLTRDNARIDSAHDPEYKPERFYYTDAITDHAIRFVADHQKQSPEKPFFLYVAYTAAHWPLHAPDEEIAKYHGRYDGGYEPVRKARFEREQKLGLIDPKWDLSPQAGDWTRVTHQPWEARRMEVYAAMVSRMDQGIGRIVAQLRESGRLDDTLFLFLQDNGACAEVIHRGAGKEPTDRMPGPADTFLSYGKEWANVSNTPFREYKHWVHEGGISTPLIVHWPAHVKDHGTLRQQPGHLVDLMATCLEVSGAKYPERFKDQPVTPLEGRSLIPAFDNRPVERDAIYWEHEGNRAVRQGQWKLVAKNPGGRWELYDTAADRTELHDLAAAQPERVRDLSAKWEAWARRANVLPWIWKPAYGAAASTAVNRLHFELKAGDDLPRDEAPQVAGRSLTVTAEIRESAADGVIVAQGGTSEGFSLYLKGGTPTFATRHGKKLAVVTAKAALPAAPVTLTAVLSYDGTVTLSANGKALGTGKVSGPLAKTPGEGLQVGRDAGGAVGEYTAPFPFAGKLGKVVIELGQ